MMSLRGPYKAKSTRATRGVSQGYVNTLGVASSPAGTPSAGESYGPVLCGAASFANMSNDPVFLLHWMGSFCSYVFFQYIDATQVSGTLSWDHIEFRPQARVEIGPLIR